MEFSVYDGPSRRIGPAIMLAVGIGILAAFGTLLLLRPHGTARIPAESYLVLIVPVGMILALFLVISFTTSVRIRIERVTGEVLRHYALFGWEVWRQRFRLSDFDRVSLNRGFRAGYRVSLVGREEDLIVFFTAKLGTARTQADEVAAECGFNVSDQL